METLRLKEAAALLKISSWTLRNWLKNPDEHVPHTKTGPGQKAHYLFEKGRLEAWWLKRMEQEDPYIDLRTRQLVRGGR